MGDEIVYVLCGVLFIIIEGEFVIIMGMFGLGKLMLLNMLGCFDIFISGEYLLDGILVCIMSKF